MKANTMAAVALVLLCGLASSGICNGEGRGLLQAPVSSDQAATVARNALTRLVSSQNLAAAEAAVAAAMPNVTVAAPANTVVSSSGQSAQQLCLLKQLQNSNPSSTAGSALITFNGQVVNCTALSTSIPNVKAAAGPAQGPYVLANVTAPVAAAAVKSGASVTASSTMAVMGGAVAGAVLLMACPALF